TRRQSAPTLKCTIALGVSTALTVLIVLPWR
ncbi:hypothetical protein LCGC14_2518030, partial [marine sediment metagenome]